MASNALLSGVRLTLPVSGYVRLSDGALLKIPSAGGNTELTGDNSNQSNSSSAASAEQTHVTVGANSDQSNASSSADISQTHGLTGAASQQVNQSTEAGLITGQESDLVLQGYLVAASVRQYQTRAARHHAAIAQKRNYKIIV